MEWVRESQWLLWIGGAIVLGIVEVASLDFVFAMLVGGALVASGLAFAGYSFTVQALAFAAVSGVLLVTVRPLAKRYLLRSAPLVPTGSDALAGRTALVLADVTARGGQVKLAGETWSARTDVPGAAFAPGDDVLVVRIDGATAVVQALPATSPPAPPAEGTGA